MGRTTEDLTASSNVGRIAITSHKRAFGAASKTEDGIRIPYAKHDAPSLNKEDNQDDVSYLQDTDSKMGRNRRAPPIGVPTRMNIVDAP